MWKRLLCVFLVLASVIVPCGVLAEDARGFETPKACAQAVFDALAAQDMAALDECFAFAELARQFDFDAYCERIQAVMPNISLLPATGPINIAYNESKLRRDFLFRLAFSTLLLNRPALSESVGNGLIVSAKDQKYADVLRMMNEASAMDCWNRLKLEAIETPAFFSYLAEQYNSERNLSNMQKMMRPWGVSEFEELVLILSLPAADGAGMAARFVLPLQTIQIGGRWLANPNSSILSNMLGISAMSLLAPLAQ